MPLEATLVSFDVERGVLVLELEGCVVELASPGSGRSYVTTGCFDVSHRGPVDRPSMQRALTRIRALEPWLQARFTPASTVHVLAFALRRPEIAQMTLSAPVGTTGASRATHRDLEFHAAFFPETDLHAFLADTTARKRAAIRELRAAFRDGPHVFVFGVARSGTRWATRVVDAILGAAGLADRTVVPALENDGGRSLEEALTAGERRYLDPHEDQLLGTLAGDPLLLAQLACGPQDILLAKADPALVPALSRLPHARFVHIRRDPRNVALSQRAYFGAPRGGLEHLVRSAITELESCTRIAAEVGAIGLRYEDLLSSPRGTIERLATRLGHPLAGESVEAISHQVSFRTMAQGRPYGQLVDGDYFRGGSSWSTEASASERRRVDKRFGARIRGLGYDDA